MQGGIDLVLSLMVVNGMVRRTGRQAGRSTCCDHHAPPEVAAEGVRDGDLGGGVDQILDGALEDVGARAPVQEVHRHVRQAVGMWVGGVKMLVDRGGRAGGYANRTGDTDRYAPEEEADGVDEDELLHALGEGRGRPAARVDCVLMGMDTRV